MVSYRQLSVGKCYEVEFDSAWPLPNLFITLNPTKMSSEQLKRIQTFLILYEETETVNDIKNNRKTYKILTPVGQVGWICFSAKYNDQIIEIC